ncbi:MAG: thiamine pyrophosphate-binding protein, partial [SAR324 cluster bacterium]|nr:thiamine pyrophosphate-binding protein [SAR324 cluster bacterium]
MMKLSDFVVQFLVKKDICDLFLVSGGGIMHLLDSVGTNSDMRYYCNYHEQACAISAEVFCRVTNKIGACLVTTGPGGTNALSGIAGAWVDSIPVLVLSGQVRRDLIADYNMIRQKGPQEGNVVEMAKPVTKYAKTILDPNTIKYELEYALFTATSGRPGPVWIDIPLDIQNSQIDENNLPSFIPAVSASARDNSKLEDDINKFIKALKEAKRPLFMFGNGIHLSQSESLMMELLELVPIPIALPHTAKDLLPEENARYVGVFGTAGQRRANF